MSPEQSHTLDRFFGVDSLLNAVWCWRLFWVPLLWNHLSLIRICFIFISHYLSNVCVVWMLNNISIVARIQSQSSFTGVGFLPFHCSKNGMENIFSQNAALQKSHLFCVHAMYDVKGDLFCNSLWNGLLHFDILWWIIHISWWTNVNSQLCSTFNLFSTFVPK